MKQWEDKIAWFARSAKFYPTLSEVAAGATETCFKRARMSASMFYIAALIFIIFTIFYVLAASAVVYHLKQYTVPQYHAPGVMITIFILLSLAFWISALYFLFQIP